MKEKTREERLGQKNHIYIDTGSEGYFEKFFFDELPIANFC